MTPNLLGTFRVALASVVVCLALQGSSPAAGQFTARLPLAITSCGQSSDAVTVSLLGKRMRLEHVLESAMMPDHLAGVRTLVIVVGASVKGLSEAGTDERRESARVSALLDRARQLGIGVIGVHVGGESRRGALSDRLIDVVTSRADYLIVTEAGNRDGLFSRVSKVRGIPLVLVSQSVEVARELRTLFPDR